MVSAAKPRERGKGREGSFPLYIHTATFAKGLPGWGKALLRPPCTVVVAGLVGRPNRKRRGEMGRGRRGRSKTWIGEVEEMGGDPSSRKRRRHFGAVGGLPPPLA